MIEVPLRNRAKEIVAFSVIDDEDWPWAQLRWYRDTRGYAVRSVPIEAGTVAREFRQRVFEYTNEDRHVRI